MKEFDEDNHYEVESLYYIEDDNYMIDEDGNPRPDILQIIPAFDFEFFRLLGGTYYKKGRTPGVMYELVFPIPDDIYCDSSSLKDLMSKRRVVDGY
jgi:hypothetical protein